MIFHKLVSPLLAGMLGLIAVTAHAESLDSKVEQLGKLSNIKIDAIRIVKRNDLLNIQTDVSNTSSSNQTLLYRFKWLDASGFQTGSEEAWKQLVVYGKERKSIQSVAPTPQAADFRLEVQNQ